MIDFKMLIEDGTLSKPVGESLIVINQFDEVICIEGSCGKHKSFTSFYVKLKSGRFLCRATEIHNYKERFIIKNKKFYHFNENS